MPDAPKTTSQDTLLPVEQRARELLVRDILVLAENATPGAWEVDEDGRPDMDWNRHIYAGEEQRICFMANSGGRNVERDYANAHLITVLVNAVPLITAALTEQTLVTPSLLSDSREAIARIQNAVDHYRFNQAAYEIRLPRSGFADNHDHAPWLTVGDLRIILAALSLPQTGVEAIDDRDIEAAAWAWLEKKFGTDNDDPVDRAYAADEMVDAFHAGRASTPKVIDRDVEGETIERIGRAVMVWGQPHFKHIVSFNVLCEAIEGALASPSLHGEGK